MRKARTQRAFLLIHRLRHQHDVFHAPQKICDARFHRWSGLDGLVNPHEVVDHEVEADRMHVVLQLLAESVGQSSEAAHSHPHAQVRALNV